MKTKLTIVLILLSFTTTFAQFTYGVSISGGLITDGGSKITAHYFHPVLTKHLFITGGFSFVNEYRHTTDDINNDYFTKNTQIFSGIQLGKYFHIMPKITYNYYGKYSSFGWGIVAGVLIPIQDTISFGLSVSHDRLRFDSNYDQFGIINPTAILLKLNFNFNTSN